MVRRLLRSLKRRLRSASGGGAPQPVVSRQRAHVGHREIDQLNLKVEGLSSCSSSSRRRPRRGQRHRGSPGRAPTSRPAGRPRAHRLTRPTPRSCSARHPRAPPALRGTVGVGRARITSRSAPRVARTASMLDYRCRATGAGSPRHGCRLTINAATRTSSGRSADRSRHVGLRERPQSPAPRSDGLGAFDRAGGQPGRTAGSSRWHGLHPPAVARPSERRGSCTAIGIHAPAHGQRASIAVIPERHRRAGNHFVSIPSAGQPDPRFHSRCCTCRGGRGRSWSARWRSRAGVHEQPRAAPEQEPPRHGRLPTSPRRATPLGLGAASATAGRPGGLRRSRRQLREGHLAAGPLAALVAHGAAPRPAQAGLDDVGRRAGGPASTTSADLELGRLFLDLEQDCDEALSAGDAEHRTAVRLAQAGEAARAVRRLEAGGTLLIAKADRSPSAAGGQLRGRSTGSAGRGAAGRRGHLPAHSFGTSTCGENGHTWVVPEDYFMKNVRELGDGLVLPQ